MFDVSRKKIDVSWKEIDTSLKEIDVSRKKIDFSLKEIDVSLKEIDVSLKKIDVSLKKIDVSLKEIDVSLKKITFSFFAKSFAKKITACVCCSYELDRNIPHLVDGNYSNAQWYLPCILLIVLLPSFVLNYDSSDLSDFADH